MDTTEVLRAPEGTYQKLTRVPVGRRGIRLGTPYTNIHVAIIPIGANLDVRLRNTNRKDRVGGISRTYCLTLTPEDEVLDYTAIEILVSPLNTREISRPGLDWVARQIDQAMKIQPGLKNPMN